MTTTLVHSSGRSLVIFLVAVAGAALQASPVSAAGGADPSPFAPIERNAPTDAVQRADPMTWPTAAPAPYSPRVLAVSAGENHACVIRLDKSLGCWGFGDGSEGIFNPPDGAFSSIGTSTNSMACAIRTVGTLACWGEDGWGGTTPPPDGTFSEVVSGSLYSCALRDDGTVACWGDNPYGHIAAPPGTFLALAAGAAHFCGIRDDGTVLCWGELESGQEHNMPAGTFEAIGAGCCHTCAIRKADHTLACWWDDPLFDDVPALEVMPPSGSFVALDGGFDHTCAIRTEGTVACWGPDVDGGQSAPPTGTFAMLSAGDDGTCGIRPTGRLVCWGGISAGAPRPVASTLVPQWVSTTRVPVRWRAAEAIAPVTSYDVKYRRTAPDGATGPYVTWRTATTATGGTLLGSPGSTYCFWVRAHDADGQVSNWSGPRCVPVPLDDRSLRRSAGWTAVTGTQFYHSTALRSTTRGATLKLPGADGLRVAVLATKCPVCGSVKVIWGGEPAVFVNLYSPTRVDRALVVSIQPIGYTGDLRIVVTSTGSTVIIDGIALVPFH